MRQIRSLAGIGFISEADIMLGRSTLIIFSRPIVMLKIIERIEQCVVYALVFLLLISVVLGTIELSRVILYGIITAPRFLVEVSMLFESFALFLVIVVGLELLKSIKSYLVHGSINPAFVIEVAIIALGNKLITLDLKHTDYKLLIGMATILLGLSVTYFVLKKACDRD